MGARAWSLEVPRIPVTHSKSKRTLFAGRRVPELFHLGWWLREGTFASARGTCHAKYHIAKENAQPKAASPNADQTPSQVSSANPSARTQPQEREAPIRSHAATGARSTHWFGHTAVRVTYLCDATAARISVVSAARERRARPAQAQDSARIARRCECPPERRHPG